MTLKRSLQNYLGSQEQAELALQAIKPYWLQRIGELTTRYKPLTDYEIQLLVEQNPEETKQQFAKTLQKQIFRAR